MEDFKKKLRHRLKGAEKIVFLGIGEEKMTDDAVGPYIISQLLDNSNEKYLFINAGIDPMSRIEEIVQFAPSHLVLLDTCTLSKPPGTVAILERDNFYESVPISSHTIPIHVVLDLILEKLPDLDAFMIGFVPQSLDGFQTLELYKKDQYTLEERGENIDLPFFELQLTETVKKAADNLITIIKQIIDNEQ
jgi:hydrogenase maturation protease